MARERTRGNRESPALIGHSPTNGPDRHCLYRLCHGSEQIQWPRYPSSHSRLRRSDTTKGGALEVLAARPSRLPGEDRERVRDRPSYFVGKVRESVPVRLWVFSEPLHDETRGDKSLVNVRQRPLALMFHCLLLVVDREGEVTRRPAATRVHFPREVVAAGGNKSVSVGVEQPRQRVVVEDVQGPARLEQAEHDRRPGIEVMEPEESSSARVDEVSGPVEFARRVEEIAAVEGRRRSKLRRRPPRVLDVEVGDVDAHDPPCSLDPERE